MNEPMFFGHSLTLLFLYFMWYSFLGWILETIYCSALQRRFVLRGFLKGPICPIYGVGALLMVLFLKGFADNILVFFIVSVVVMSAWEYLVGWFLDVTTHIKYWDYSQRKFNLHGRICLQNSMYWGVIAYAAIYWVHPATVHLFRDITPNVRYAASTLLFLVTAADTVTTIRSLTLAASFLKKALEVRVEMEKRRKAIALASRQHLEEAAVHASLLKLELRELELRERSFLADAQHYLARFRHRYPDLKSVSYEKLFKSIHERSEQLREFRSNRVEELRRMAEIRRMIEHHENNN